MKSTTKSSSGIFKMVPQFLQRSTDRLHVDPGGSLPTLSWMIWHHTGFCSLFSLFRVPSGVGATGWSVCTFFCSSAIFVPVGSAVLNVLIWYRTFRIFHRDLVTSTAWRYTPIGDAKRDEIGENLRKTEIEKNARTVHAKKRFVWWFLSFSFLVMMWRSCKDILNVENIRYNRPN